MGVDSCKKDGKHNEWGTHPNLFDIINSNFKFTLDPCCNKLNRKCDKYFTAADDGLKQDWNNNIVFMNPPYSNRSISKWIDVLADMRHHASHKTIKIPAPLVSEAE